MPRGPGGAGILLFVLLVTAALSAATSGRGRESLGEFQSRLAADAYHSFGPLLSTCRGTTDSCGSEDLVNVRSALGA